MQLSSLIVNIMKKIGHVADVRNPITGEIIKSVGSLFVDDANIFVYLWQQGKIKISWSLVC